MIFYCPLAYSSDCNAKRCTFFGSSRCVDGQLSAIISDCESGQVVSCPRANSSNCNAARCSLWGTGRCNDGEIHIRIDC